jgi:hypothetical protein
LETNLSGPGGDLRSSAIASLWLRPQLNLLNVPAVTFATFDGTVKEGGEVIAAHVSCGNSAEPRMLVGQRGHTCAHPSAHWLLGVALNLVKEAQRCFAWGKLNRLWRHDWRTG